MNHGICRSCVQSILWVKLLPKLSAHPLDPEPVDGGNIVLLGDGTARVLRKDEAAPEGAARFKSHFATCLFAASHRRK